MGIVHLQNRKSIHIISALRLNVHLLAWLVLRVTVFVNCYPTYNLKVEDSKVIYFSLFLKFSIYDNLYIFGKGWNTAFWERPRQPRNKQTVAWSLFLYWINKLIRVWLVHKVPIRGNPTECRPQLNPGFTFGIRSGLTSCLLEQT